MQKQKQKIMPKKQSTLIPYVYIITYGDQIEVVTRSVLACYQFLQEMIPKFLHQNIKSYSQVARDLQKGKEVVIALPQRFPYNINRYDCIKKYESKQT